MYGFFQRVILAAELDGTRVNLRAGVRIVRAELSLRPHRKTGRLGDATLPSSVGASTANEALAEETH